MPLTLAVLLFLLPLAPPAWARTPQCREATDQAIAAFKSSMPKMPEGDREGAQALIAPLERRVKDRRANGMDECAIWQGIASRVSNS